MSNSTHSIHDHTVSNFQKVEANFEMEKVIIHVDAYMHVRPFPMTAHATGCFHAFPASLHSHGAVPVLCRVQRVLLGLDPGLYGGP